MLTANLTCVALPSTGAYFDGPTTDGSGCAVRKANHGCSHVSKLVVHTSVSQCAEVPSFDA